MNVGWKFPIEYFYEEMMPVPALPYAIFISLLQNSSESCEFQKCGKWTPGAATQGLLRKPINYWKRAITLELRRGVGSAACRKREHWRKKINKSLIKSSESQRV